MTRVGRFAAVGVVGWIVQLGVLAVLVQLGVHYLLATALAVEITILHNFAWHERYTWRDAAIGSPAAVLRRLVRFNLSTALVSLVGNVLGTALVVEYLHFPAAIGNTVAVLCLSTLNFGVASRLIWFR